MTVAATSAASTASAASRTTLATNFETFLQLLTAQLRNQDPTSPLDTNQFTQQLVQYSEVEQAIRTNQMLEQLISAQSNQGASAALGYLGRTIVVESDTAYLDETGDVAWRYEFAEAPQASALRVLDAQGREVGRIEGPTTAGVHDFVWDGERPNGERVPAGIYRLEIVAVDANGDELESRIVTDERVISVETTSEGVRLVTAIGRRELSDVIAVRE